MNPGAPKLADGIRRVALDTGATHTVADPRVAAGEQGRLDVSAPFNLVLLQGWMISVMRTLFEEPANALFPQAALRWSPGQHSTGPACLWIDSAGAFKPREAGFLPAVLVRLNDGEVGGLTKGRGTDIIGRDDAAQTTAYATTYRGTVQFIALADGESPCLLLVSEVLDRLKAAATQVRDTFCFARFDVIGFAVPRTDKADGAPNRYKGEVRVSYEYCDTWTLSSEAPRIKVFDFKASTRA